jgi:hypothetical protein
VTTDEIAAVEAARISNNFYRDDPFLLNVPSTSDGLANAATYPKLLDKLTRESAGSVFTSTGRLTQEAIDSAKVIPELGPGKLNNSNIPSGFGKYATETFPSPSGNFQVHFYMNPITKEVFYDFDYKVVFNKMSGVSKKP